MAKSAKDREETAGLIFEFINTLVEIQDIGKQAPAEIQRQILDVCTTAGDYLKTL